MKPPAELTMPLPGSRTKLRTFGALAFVLLVALIPLLPLPKFWIIQLNYIGIYVLPTLGLVLLTGISKLTSFGQAAFVGIGAYTTAYLSVNHGLSPSLTLLIGLVLTALSATLIGLITLPMSGHYLPLATLAWALSLYYVMGNLDALGKYDGILGVPDLSIFGFELGQLRGIYVVIWGIVIIATFAVIRLLDSRSGRAVRALAHGSQMAEAMGVNTLRFKTGIFVLAALLASISGWLFAYFQHTVNPSPFGLKMGIEYLFMAVLGGVGHVWGAIIGAGLLKLLEDQLQILLPYLIGTSGSYELIVFGILLVVILKYQPSGLWDVIDRRLPRVRHETNWRDAKALSVITKPASGEVVLDVERIRKTFGGLVAVNDISFQVRAGQIVGLIGPNGAGKSTTFNLITGALDLSGGTVRMNGETVSGRGPRQIAARGVSRTFQHVKLVPEMTALENAALGAHLRGRAGIVSAMLGADGMEEASLFREAEHQLRRVGLGDQLHELAGNLAMGQQRLLEIARSLCADPTLLLLDEPAAGLRHLEKRALAKVLRNLSGEGMSILLVEHDMSLVMNVCNHIVVMEFGTHLMEGSPQQVQASEKVRAAYLGKEH